jgi:hypothetical protein
VDEERRNKDKKPPAKSELDNHQMDLWSGLESSQVSAKITLKVNDQKL